MAQIVPQPAPQLRPFRLLTILACFHVTAAALDINFYYSQTQPLAFNWSASVAMFQCDAALLCCLFLNCKNVPPRFWIALPILLSVLTLGFILNGWIDFGGLLGGYLPTHVTSTQGLCLLLTPLLLPSLTGIYWLLGRRERSSWHWRFFTGLSLLALSATYFASTAFNYSPTRAHSYWIDQSWLRYLVTAIAAIQCVTSIAVAVWTFDRFHCPGAWRWIPWLLGIGAAMACAAYLAIFVNIWIVTGSFGSKGRFPKSLFLTEAWTAASLAAADFVVPALTGLLMLVLATCFWFSSAWHFQNAVPAGTLHRPMPLHLPVLASENRRLQLWHLAGVGLFLSALSLALGFYAWTIHIKGGRFADQGILFEVLLMAPLGLWSAQMAASAIFLECRIWNFWKRLLIVLAWAEITLLAFWGQVALSDALRWRPSDYVGAVLNITLGALLLSLVGRLINKQTGAAPYCRYFPSEDTPTSVRGRFSLSLSDIICLVAISAALIYPISVVLALEQWPSAKSLLEDFLLNSYWPLTSGAASYFALRAALSSGKKALAPFTLFLLCLFASTASDQLILAFILDDLYFGVRWSVGMLAFPGLFLGTSVLAISLRYLGFRMFDSQKAPRIKLDATIRDSDYGPIPEEAQPTVTIPAKAPSPWD